MTKLFQLTILTSNNIDYNLEKINIIELIETVIEQNGNIAQIYFSNITSGLYLVKITSEKEIIVKKIIKK